MEEVLQSSVHTTTLENEPVLVVNSPYSVSFLPLIDQDEEQQFSMSLSDLRILCKSPSLSLSLSLSLSISSLLFPVYISLLSLFSLLFSLFHPLSVLF